MSECACVYIYSGWEWILSHPSTNLLKCHSFPYTPTKCLTPFFVIRNLDVLVVDFVFVKHQVAFPEVPHHHNPKARWLICSFTPSTELSIKLHYIDIRQFTVLSFIVSPQGRT